MKAVLEPQASQQYRTASPPSRSTQHRSTADAGFVDNRPEAMAQQKLIDAIHHSPAMVAQRKQLQGLFGSAAQLQGGEEEDLQMKQASSAPIQLNALAYAQGIDIHVASRQERHLPHEAWHVVQQVKGRVQPTINVNGAAVNDHEALESEATTMGEKSVQHVANKEVKNLLQRD
ncbi:MAG: hypothetical protein GKS05_09570 [Nitrospirales bacterium]|nr:hypothetical protein [Nitrospirales bacterium]